VSDISSFFANGSVLKAKIKIEIESGKTK